MVQRIEILGQVKDDRPCISLFCILLYPLNCIFCTPFRSVSETSFCELRLINRYQLLWYRLLDNAVCDGGNTKLSYSAVRLRDFHSSDRGRGIVPFPYPLCQFMAMFLQPRKRLFDSHSIYSRRSLVCLHSFVSSVQIVLTQYLT